MATTNDDWAIQATDDLVIELWPAAPGDRADRLRRETSARAQSSAQPNGHCSGCEASPPGGTVKIAPSSSSTCPKRAIWSRRVTTCNATALKLQHSSPFYSV